MSNAELEILCYKNGCPGLACRCVAASLAAMTARVDELAVMLAKCNEDFDAESDENDAATAALLALGCERRDGVWGKYEEPEGTGENLIWLPISPPPTPAKEKP